MKPLNPKLDPFALLGDWKFEPVFREKTTIESVDVYLTGMQAMHPKWGGVVGSAAHLEAFPENSAWYELMERIAILKAMQEKKIYLRDPQTEAKIGIVSGEEVFPLTQQTNAQYAKSNGVALFTNWPEACRRATLELVERHLILASWLGYVKPEKLGLVPRTALSSLERIYRVEHYSLGTQKVSTLEAEASVSCVVLWPKDDQYPLVFAFGAGENRTESLAKAEAETWQRLGFLWGEEVPREDPEFVPNQLFHQEIYLNPKNRHRIEKWLSGKYFDKKLPPLARELTMSFADLSSAQTLNLHVAKAMAPEAIPLVFGYWRGGLFQTIDDERLIHPIA